MRSFLISMFIFLAACSIRTPEQRLDNLERAQTFELWSAQRTTQNADELRVVEFELVRRGEFRSGRSFVGQRSAASIGQSVFERNAGDGSDLFNCSDFPNSISAQREFIRSGGPANDPNSLDADGDGFACEWGTEIRRIARNARPRPAAVIRSPARITRPRCHIGP